MIYMIQRYRRNRKNFSRRDPIDGQIIRIPAIVFVNTVRCAVIRLGF